MKRKLPGRWAGMRHYAYANLTAEEYARVRQLATRDGQTISDFVRACINDRLVEEADDPALVRLTEQPPRKSRQPG